MNCNSLAWLSETFFLYIWPSSVPGQVLSMNMWLACSGLEYGSGYFPQQATIQWQRMSQTVRGLHTDPTTKTPHLGTICLVGDVCAIFSACAWCWALDMSAGNAVGGNDWRILLRYWTMTIHCKIEPELRYAIDSLPSQNFGPILPMHMFCLRLVSWEQRIMMKTQSGSLKSYLRKQYGQETQKIVDVFGKELQRVALFANHHHFNIRCLKTGHCPPSLKLKSPVNTDRARQAADSTHCFQVSVCRTITFFHAAKVTLFVIRFL